MSRFAWTLSLLLALAHAGCRKGDDPSSAAQGAPASTAPTQAASTTMPSPVSTKSDVGSSEKASAPVGLADGLPDLKPIIEKPFPEGATEEQVCEAVSNTKEKDLWVRFGHLLPVFNYGSIFIVAGGASAMEKIESFVRNDYIPGLYRADMKNCKDLVLVWIRDMVEETRVKFQRDEHGGKHFEGKLQDVLGLTVREAIFVDGSKEKFRLSDYCRADAELCARLIGISRQHKYGLCGNILYDPELLDIPAKKRAELCSRLPARDLACLVFEFPDDAEGVEALSECRSRVKVKILELK